MVSSPGPKFFRSLPYRILSASHRVVIPEEMLEHLGVKAGDLIYFEKGNDHHVRLSRMKWSEATKGR